MSDSSTKLPTGQVLTTRFPPIGERAPTPDALNEASWELEVLGEVEAPKVWGWEEFMGLPQREREVDIHCVTGWTRLGTRFTGVPLAELLALSRPTPEARFVRFEAYSERRHDTSLPLEVALEDTWLVHGVDGNPLGVKHGGPLRTLTPSRWFYKSLKWVHRIELLTEDQLGFWERESGYHNNADPWAESEERYVHGDLSVPMLERFKTTKRLERYRGQVILHADLSGWNPLDRDLRNLQLKNCDLRGAQLADTDLRGANLTRCKLGGADLRGADLRGADLEGANLAGADLRGADMSGALVTATRFFGAFDGEVAQEPALVEGLRWEGLDGLLEDAEAFLRGGA